MSDSAKISLQVHLDVQAFAKGADTVLAALCVEGEAEAEAEVAGQEGVSDRVAMPRLQALIAEVVL